MRVIVKEICNEKFEDEISKIEKIEGGLMSHTFKVSTSDRDFILQIGKAAEPHELENCVKSFKFLKNSAVPVPRVISGLEQKNSISYIIVNFVQGEPLGDNFTPSDAEKAGEILAEIHNFCEFDEAGWIEWESGEPNVTGFPGGSLGSRITQLMNDRAEFFRDQELEELADFASRFVNKHSRKIPEQFESVFVHHDFNPGNILAKDGEITAILDFDYAHSSHPHRDLAKASNKFWLRNGNRSDLYRGYRKNRGISDSFSINEPLFKLESLIDEIAAMLNHDEITKKEALNYIDELERIEDKLERVSQN